MNIIIAAELKFGIKFTTSEIEALKNVGDFVALIKKHSGYGRPTQADVSFTKRELMRLIGRA